MTRKDFKAFAEAIKAMREKGDRKRIAKVVVQVATRLNERFNKELFLEACGIEEKPHSPFARS